MIDESVELLQYVKNTKLYQKLHPLKDFFPAIFFLAGFVWDAVTIGNQVALLDLITFSVYLLGASLLLFLMSRPSYILVDLEKIPRYLHWLYTSSLPYLALQFLFGSLLSALFILYFKSSSYAMAWVITLVLGCLLVANEFLENEYRKFSFSWALLGLCAMLLFNFVIPFLMGSVHAAWFYTSTMLGAGLVIILYKQTPRHLGSILPVWLIAILLMLAYSQDMIPPVPLVKREVVMAYQLDKVNGDYWLTQEKAPWWKLWKSTSDDLWIESGRPIYCFSSIFAPPGLKTKLYHHWQLHTKQGWVTQSRIGFSLNGGRHDGYRGYTFKQNLSAGDWRVRLETETNKTIAVHHFTIHQNRRSEHTIKTKH